MLRDNKKISKYILLQENYFLFRITNAAITPGTQPKTVKSKTINIDPQPWSYTANGGKIILNKTRNSDIIFYFDDNLIILRNISLPIFKSESGKS